MDQSKFDQYCAINNGSLICIHDPTLKFISVSASCEKITGYTIQQLKGQNPYDFYHEADKESIQKKGHYPALDGKANIEIIYRFRKSNGTFIWLKTLLTPIENESGIITQLISISTDYSEFVFAHNEFIEKDKLYSSVFKAGKIGVWEAELESNIITWSKSAYDIFELDYHTTLNDEVAFNFFTDESKIIVKSANDNAVNKGIPYDIKAAIITARNNKRWVRVIVKPSLNFGKTVKLYGAFQDITFEAEKQVNSKTFTDKLSSQKRQLEDFNQIISHNLRSPVTNIGILLNLLKSSTLEDERNLFIDKLSSLASNLNTLLDDLVDVVKVMSSSDIKADVLSVDDIICNVSKMLEGDIKETDASIQIHTTVWNEIEFPKIYMESIMLNLISNALKYISPERKPFITIETFVENNVKGIRVSDNGLGINLDKYGDQVFKLNKTFHREKPGKGLGLFMTKNQVESWGGEISLTSEVNKGTTFTIVFEKN